MQHFTTVSVVQVYAQLSTTSLVGAQWPCYLTADYTEPAGRGSLRDVDGRVAVWVDRGWGPTLDVQHVGAIPASGRGGRRGHSLQQPRTTKRRVHYPLLSDFAAPPLLSKHGGVLCVQPTLGATEALKLAQCVAMGFFCFVCRTPALAATGD